MAVRDLHFIYNNGDLIMQNILDLIYDYCYRHNEQIPVTNDERLKLMTRLNQVGYITAEELELFISSNGQEKLVAGHRVSVF